MRFKTKLLISSFLGIICRVDAFQLDDAAEELVRFGAPGNVFQPVFVEGGTVGETLTVVKITGVNSPLSTRQLDDDQKFLKPKLDKIDDATFKLSIELPKLNDWTQGNPTFYFIISESTGEEQFLAVIFTRKPLETLSNTNQDSLH